MKIMYAKRIHIDKFTKYHNPAQNKRKKYFVALPLRPPADENEGALGPMGVLTAPIPPTPAHPFSEDASHS